MSVMVIDINDQAITFMLSQQSMSQSGYAFVDEQNILFGEEARQAGKKAPLQCFHHYWQQINDEPIHSKNGDVHSHVDLVYWQLYQLSQEQAKLGKAESVILLVPNYYNGKQLSILLGVCKACQLNVVEIIANDVAKAYSGLHHLNLPTNTMQLLDIDLHQCRLSQCFVEDEIRTTGEQVFAKKGVHQLYQEMADWLNKRFISECRFDAYHQGQTEQILATHTLKLLCDNWQGSVFDVEINEHKIQVNQQEVSQLVGQFFDFLLPAIIDDIPLVIAPAMADLAKHYSLLASKPQVALSYDDIFHALVTKNCRTSSDAPLYVQRTLVANGFVNQVKEHASHIVLADRAYPLAKQPIYINANPNQPLSLQAQDTSCLKLATDGTLQLLLDSQVQVNDIRAIDGQTLHCSDEIKVASSVFRLIKVEQDVNWDG